jgi:excisionase family DNA binding protein
MDSNVSPARPTDLIEPAQGAKILGISGPTLWAWIRSGKLRAWRLDAVRMGVSRADVEAILQPVATTALPRPQGVPPGKDFSGECDARKARMDRVK